MKWPEESIMVAVLRTLFFLSTCVVVQCGRILFLPAHNGASHTKSMYPAAEALQRAGHQVVMLQLIDDSTHACQNKAGVIDRIIYTIRKDEVVGDDTTAMSQMFWSSSTVGMMGMLVPWKLTTDTCVRILSNEKTKSEFNEILNETWDALFVDPIFAACGLFALNERKANESATVVEFSTTILFFTTTDSRGATAPSSIAPSINHPHYNQMAFSYRLSTTLDDIRFRILCRMLEFLVPYWGRSVAFNGTSPSILHEGSSFAVTSMPVSLDFPQPWAFDLSDMDANCETGGAEIPEPFGSFIANSSSRGTIIFAMGHFADWNYAPAGVLDAFLEAFAQLSEYRVIWQFGSKNSRPHNPPSNILMEQWLPQSAILNHPNTKVFISHMGLKSMREAICARVPLVAMPMFAEQQRNAALAGKRGFAVFLDKTNLSADAIYSAIKRVLDEDRYAVAVGRLQDQLSDRIRNTSTLLAFKLEYFKRHRNVLKKYVSIRWKRLSTLTKWFQAELIAPVVALLLISCMLLF